MCLLSIVDAHDADQTTTHVGTNQDYVGQTWVIYDDHYLQGNNNGEILSVTQSQCIQACTELTNMDCWSVEYVIGTTGTEPQCKFQFATIFGGIYGITGLKDDVTFKTIERSCKILNNIVNRLNVASPTDYTMKSNSFTNGQDIDYQIKRNSAIKPFFKWGFDPFPESSLKNCKINFKLTIGTESCSPSVDWVDGDNLVFADKSCTISASHGVRGDIGFKIDNTGKVEVTNAAPYYEDTFHYKIEATVVGFDSYVLEGEFNLLCSSSDTLITQNVPFSTSSYVFLQKQGGFSLLPNFEEFVVTAECYIIKYEIQDYTSNQAFTSVADQVSFDTNGCVTSIPQGSITYLGNTYYPVSETGQLCNKLKIRADRINEKHTFKIKVTASGILHPRPEKTFVSQVLTSEIICGPMTTSLSVPIMANNFYQNQQYLPDSTNSGFISPQFISSSDTECPINTYQVLTGPPTNACSYQTYRSLTTASVGSYICGNQLTEPILSTFSGLSLQQCTDQCKSAGGNSMRYKTNGGLECHCYNDQCSGYIINGLENEYWESYYFDCTTSLIDTTIFTGSANLLSTKQSTARALRMLHPDQLVRTNKEVIKDSYLNTIKAYLVDRSTPRKETFYIVGIADGGSRIVQGPFTINIQCDYTIEIREPSVFTTQYSFILGAASSIEEFIFPSFSAWDSDEPTRNIESICPIITYEPEVNSGITKKIGCGSPCYTLNIVNQEPSIFQSTIKVYAEGDAIFSSQIITANILCGPLSVTITLPSINSPYMYPIKLSDSDRPRVEIPNPTSNQPKCEIIKITLTHDGVNQVHDQLESQIDMVSFDNFSPTGKIIERVKQGYTYVPGNYQFYFEIEAKGGSKQLSPLIELIVFCDQNSVEITEPFIQSLQIYAQGDKNIRFSFLDFINRQIYCPIESYEIIDKNGNPTLSFQQTGNLISSRQGGLISADIIDRFTQKNYTFYIKVSAKGGQTIIAGPMEVRVGCHQYIPIEYDPSSFNGNAQLNLTFPLFEKRTQKLQFSINGIKSSNSYCKIVNYELIESESLPEMRKLVRPFFKPKDVYMFQNCTSPPCNVVEFSQNYAVVYKFWILVTAEGGAELILPNQFSRIIKETDLTIINANMQRIEIQNETGINMEVNQDTNQTQLKENGNQQLQDNVEELVQDQSQNQTYELIDENLMKEDININKISNNSSNFTQSEQSKAANDTIKTLNLVQQNEIVKEKQLDEFIENMVIKQRRINTTEINEKKRIDMEIVSILPNGKLRIDFSESLHNLIDFEKYGMNKTYWKEIQNRILQVSYTCNQYPYKSQAKNVQRNLGTSNIGDIELSEGETIPVLESWTIESFSREGIDLQLNFSNPLLVSAYYNLDFLQIQIKKHKFFSSISDYQFVEENYIMKAKPLPQLMKTNDKSIDGDILLIKILLFSVLFIPLLAMCCLQDLTMGRVWSLYFMLQIVTNIINFSNIQIPANAMQVLEVVEQISNFKLCQLMWGLNGQIRDMVFFGFIYFVVLLCIWGVWKQFPKSKVIFKIKKMLLWSPILRCLMMTWFSTAIWTFTYFHGSANGFQENSNIIFLNQGQSNARRSLEFSITGRSLSGLNQTYNPHPDTGFFGVLLSLFKCIVLIGFPIISYNYLNYYFERLNVLEFRMKYSTLYTDMWIRKQTAVQSIAILCFRRFLLVLTTVFLNSYLVPSLFVYFYGSILLLWYYIYHHPFDRKWAYKLELVNESFVMVTAYFSFLFTEFVMDIEARYQFGAFLVDILVWIVVINLIGIIYELYVFSARFYKKYLYEGMWRAHLKLKEELALLIIEYENYDEEDRKFEQHKLMIWCMQDLQKRLDELRKQHELEKAEQEKAEAAARLPLVKSFAAFMDNEPEVLLTHTRVTTFKIDNFNKSLEKVVEAENENSEFSISINQGVKSQIIDDIYQDDGDGEIVNILGLGGASQFQHVDNTKKLGEQISTEDIQDDTFRLQTVDYSKKKNVSKFGIFMNDLECEPQQIQIEDQDGLDNDELAQKSLEEDENDEESEEVEWNEKCQHCQGHGGKHNNISIDIEKGRSPKHDIPSQRTWQAADQEISFEKYLNRTITKNEVEVQKSNILDRVRQNFAQFMDNKEFSSSLAKRVSFSDQAPQKIVSALDRNSPERIVSSSLFRSDGDNGLDEKSK